LSDGESFECFGENEMTENGSGVELELSAPQNSSVIRYDSKKYILINFK
jgi:hypothetical protein